MIYLFNSGYRTLYTTNVLNTLYLPNGCTNEYRYKVHGDIIHISTEAYSDFKNNCKPGEKTIIVLVDRFGQSGYIYHPLRFAELVKCFENDGRLFFRVKLTDYIYPRNINKFNEMFVKTLGSKGIPKLTKNDPKNADDGYYAIKAGSVFDHEDDFYRNDIAWENCVSSIRSVKVFNEEHDIDVLFLRSSLVIKGKKERSIKPVISNESSIINLTRGSKYELILSYKFPVQLVNPHTNGKIKVNLGENLRTLGTEYLNVDSSSNTIRFPFITKRNLEDFESGLTLFYEHSDNTKKLIGSDSNLQFKIKESNRFWIQMAFGLILFTILGVVIGTDFSKIIPLTISNIVSSLWIKALFGFSQAFVLFWLFKLVGKKFL